MDRIDLHLQQWWIEFNAEVRKCAVLQLTTRNPKEQIAIDNFVKGEVPGGGCCQGWNEPLS